MMTMVMMMMMKIDMIMMIIDQLYPRLKVSSMTGEISFAAVRMLCSASYLVIVVVIVIAIIMAFLRLHSIIHHRVALFTFLF